MKVSIIVPIYNTEHYLDNCVNSIINQTYRNLEIILVNDGSKDNSGDICDKFSVLDKRIKVIHKENGGVSSARNIGLDICSGDYIMFVDSDDWIENTTVDKLIDIQKEGNFDVVMFGVYFEYTKQNKVKNYIFKNEKFYELSKITSLLPSLIKEEKINALWNKFYSSALIKENNIKFNESLNIAEDALFNYQIFMHVKSYCTLNDCFYHYMIRNDEESLSKKYNSSKYAMLIFVNDFLHQNIKLGHINFAVIQAANYIRIKNIYSCLLDLFNNNYSISKKEKLLTIKNILLNESEFNYKKTGSISFSLLGWVLSTKRVNFIYFIVFLLAKLRNIK